MKKIKGRYVAIMTIDFDFGENETGVSVEDVRETLGDISPLIKQLIEEQLYLFTTKIDVCQQYLNLYEVEE